MTYRPTSCAKLLAPLALAAVAGCGGATSSCPAASAQPPASPDASGSTGGAAVDPESEGCQRELYNQALRDGRKLLEHVREAADVVARAEEHLSRAVDPARPPESIDWPGQSHDDAPELAYA